jgi:hypothetical protein
MKIRPAILLLLLVGVISHLEAKKVPGIVVDHIPASTKTYIGSPSIAILPNGDYVASHDFFGPGSTENQQGQIAVFKSENRGKSWRKVSEMKGQYWSNLFIHQNFLYIMGCSKQHGNIVIRRSEDGGITWSEPKDSLSGLLFKGEYHTAPMPMVIYNDRLCRAIENAKSNTTAWGKRYSAMVVSAPINSNLLMAENWSATNSLPYDSTFLAGNFGGWLEGNAVVTPAGKLIDLLRVETAEKGRDMAAIVNISDDVRTATFNPGTGFIDFVGGARKFSVRYDEQSKKYWTISNKVTEAFLSQPAGSVRNTLVLKGSSDLKNWSICKVLLQHPDVKKHGFQYVDWQFDGKDIIFLSRTAFDDGVGGAGNFHNANFLTFHRIKNFRKLTK